MPTGDPICCVITYNTMVTSFSLNMEAMSGRWRGLIKGGFYERNDLCRPSICYLWNAEMCVGWWNGISSILVR